MTYIKERSFIETLFDSIYDKHLDKKPMHISQKAEFDLVTDIDYAIETYVINEINKCFPTDKILSEETNATTKVAGRIWTIDPIDGTCNMAHGIKLYGVQIALIDNGVIVVAGVYIPHLGEKYIAVKQQGVQLNGETVFANKNTALNNAIVSFGDYKHNNDALATKQHKAIGKLYPQIAKIRMFGAACLDFSFVSCGKTDGTVIITKNLWDIAPGILLCQEGNAIIKNLDGNDYTFADNGIIVASNESVLQVLVDSLSP